MERLALLGGRAVRRTPFKASVVVDDREMALVKEVLERQEFSRFMGSPSEKIKEELVLPSTQAESFAAGQYFTFLGGRMVRRFESVFAQKLGAPYAISVNSATSGLSTALGAAGLGPGDEVITTCMSFNATGTSILLFNSIPIFVDVLPGTYCLDPDKIREALSEKTKAILVVHLLGFPAPMDEIMSIAENNGLVVIEDCAQAIGTTYKGRPVGTIGHLGVFSFQETKNIMTGEGGMIITHDPDLARACRLIRNHGESIPDDSWGEDALVNIVGMNFRMTELTAALGIAQMEKVDANNRRRAENTRFLIDALSDIDPLGLPRFPEGAVPHVLPLVYTGATDGAERDKILLALRAEGIPVGAGYLRLMPENPIFQKKIAYGRQQCPWSCQQYGRECNAYEKSMFPVAAGLLAEQFIWFYHIHAPNTQEDMQDVAAAFHKVFSHLETLKKQNIDDIQLAYKW